MLFCNNYTYTPICQWCLEEVLGMKDYFINVINCVFLDCKSGEFTPPDQIHISQDLVHPHDLRTIFHELRHYYQFKTGMFDFKAQNYMYDFPKDATEDAKRIIAYYSYLNFPWELDANKFAMETLRQFFKTPLAKSHIPSNGRR
jgi:hypothetical protein